MSRHRMTLLFTNDLHDRRAALAFLARFPRPPASLLVDCGDAIRGSNTVFCFRESILEEMTRLGYAAMALGNREFHYLRGVLASRAAQKGFPFLCANLQDLRGRLNGAFSPSLVVTVGEVRVGLVGLTPVQYPPGSLWERLFGFRFHHPVETLKQWVPRVAKEADLVVVLSHSGLDTDRMLAREVPEIHLILGGHSHTPLLEPERVGQCILLQAGYYGSLVGRADLEIEPGRAPTPVVSLAARLIPVSGETAP